MKTASALAAIALAISGGTASAAADDFANRVGFDQHVGRPLPLDLTVYNEHGEPLRLGSLFKGRPVILVLAYYECPNLCTIVLNGLLDSVRDLKPSAGADYDIIVASIDPDETAALAAAKKESHLRRYGRANSDDGWRFLTAKSEAVERLAESVGYRFYYDAATDQFAHPSGIVIVSPNGKISQYFLGIEYPPSELARALAGASREEIGPLARELLLLCFHYDPSTGKYSLAVTRIVRLAGVLTVLGLLAGIVVMNRSARPRTPC
jgi:protein SCO1/2